MTMRFVVDSRYECICECSMKNKNISLAISSIHLFWKVSWVCFLWSENFSTRTEKSAGCLCFHGINKLKHKHKRNISLLLDEIMRKDFFYMKMSKNTRGRWNFNQYSLKFSKRWWALNFYRGGRKKSKITINLVAVCNSLETMITNHLSWDPCMSLFPYWFLSSTLCILVQFTIVIYATLFVIGLRKICTKLTTS